ARRSKLGCLRQPLLMTFPVTDGRCFRFSAATEKHNLIACCGKRHRRAVTTRLTVAKRLPAAAPAGTPLIRLPFCHTYWLWIAGSGHAGCPGTVTNISSPGNRRG